MKLREEHLEKTLSFNGKLVGDLLRKVFPSDKKNYFNSELLKKESTSYRPNLKRKKNSYKCLCA